MRGMGIAAALVGHALVASCGSGGAFPCAEHGDCNGGVCAEGFCAFPAEGCASGLQYGAHSGPMSNLCVPANGDGSGGSGGADGGPESSTSGGDDATPTSTLPPVDGTADGTSTSMPGGEVVFTDDELDGEFGAGTFTGTAFAGARLSLEPDTTGGTFRSRVFDAGADAEWTSLEWLPDAPYDKPLPDGGASEAGYAMDAVDMRGNVLLFHLDAASQSLSLGEQIDDASGQRTHGVVTGADAAAVVLGPGRFGSAWVDDLATFVSVDTASAPQLELGTDDFTWALWFRTDAPCPTNYVFMGVDNTEGTASTPNPHLWLGCTDDEWPECPGGGSADHLGGVFRSIQGNTDDGAFYCHPTAIDDDAWHHVAITKTGHPDSTLRLHLDGALVHEVDASFVADLTYPDQPDFAFGGFSHGTYPTLGTFDEIAIWRRALTSDEVLALARRGTLSVGVSVRACEMADCADDPPFVGGVALAPGSVFVDPMGALEPGTEISLDGLGPSRFVQYQVAMSGRLQDVAPQIASVTLRGEI